MVAVLPGKPQSQPQALATGLWDGCHYNTYISGSAFTILEGASKILQTIYDNDDEENDDSSSSHLRAIAFDEATGKIATCTAVDIRLYRPNILGDGKPKWSQQAYFDIPHPSDDTISSLSWGASEELLVGSKSLSLFATSVSSSCIWQKKTASPVQSALLSHDSAYVASISRHDCLPKVWRRLTYSADEVQFGMTYLQHPDIVTAIRWRKPFHPDQSSDNILYTFCLDDSVRIWIPAEMTEGQHWQMWGRIDLNDKSVGRQLTPGHSHAAFIMDGRDFTAAVESAVQERMKDDHTTDDAALDHLVAIANRNPEICLGINSRGVMSAWAIENVGSNDVNTQRIFNIAEVSLPRQSNGVLSDLDHQHAEIQAYCDKVNGTLHFLFHNFDGRIGVFVSNIADLLDPVVNDRRLLLQTIWTGHKTPIKKIVRNFSGHAIVSRTASGECILWQHAGMGTESANTPLSRRSIIPETQSIRRICVLRKGRFVVFLCDNAISLWDCRRDPALLLSRCSFDILGTPLCLILLPRPTSTGSRVAHVATVTSKGHGIVWELNLPQYLSDSTGSNTTGVRQFCQFELETTEVLKYVLPVDPAGPSPVMSGFLDVFARDVAISYTNKGKVDFWTARVNLQHQTVDWLSTSSTETGLVDPAMASGSMLKKAALVNTTRSQLTIWDIGSSRLEFEKDFTTHASIQDLDWTSTPDSQAILAVGFPHRVLLLSQMRFDYLNKGPAWAPIHEIKIRDLTGHPIGDSVWLADGHLAIGAGNQLFVYDRSLGAGDIPSAETLPYHKQNKRDLFSIVQRFNGPIPVFHPQFLSQCVLSGKGHLVRRILLELHKTMKFLVPGDVVDDYLGLHLSEFYVTEETRTTAPGKVGNSFLEEERTEDEVVFSEQTATSINEKLTKVRISQLSGVEQIQLADMIECVASVERHRRSMDENGARFMLFFRQHVLRKGRANEMYLSWREINWAFHSSSQDLLLDFVSRQNHGSMLWEQARECGIFMWLSDLTALRGQFETIARNEYTRNEAKDPVNCSLFYLALRKKTVLQGLWRMAGSNKEQVATQKLLANNFEDAKWRRTALKNAYALLSKRRFQYAAAFFLLADHLNDAVEVCLRQLQDIQLAVAVCRAYEGDDGPVLRKLIQDEILPLAAHEGNRWLASWAFWMLGRKDMAVRALIMPVFALLETPCSPDIKSRIFLTDDPALVVLYSQLRQRTLQTLRGASKITPKVEWEFVLHSAKLYDRMGCDLLGLDLVRNWEFQQPVESGFGGEANPLKLLRRRSSLVVDDISATRRSLRLEQSNPSGNKSRSANLPTFEEPDAASLLDSFGL